jgi:hypothetical protein
LGKGSGEWGADVKLLSAGPFSVWNSMTDDLMFAGIQAENESGRNIRVRIRISGSGMTIFVNSAILNIPFCN